MNKQTAFVLVILGLLLACCRGKELEISLPYSGDRLVLWGKLVAGKPIRIQVTRTFNPIGDIPTNVAVKNAIVIVFKNGKEWITLASSDSEPGIYISSAPISTGETYRIKVRAEGYPNAECEEIPIPGLISGISYLRERDVAGIVNPQTPQDHISLLIPETEHYGDKYFMLTFLSYYKDDIRTAYWPAPDNVVSNEVDCHTWASNERGRNALFLFSGQCLATSGTPLNFFIENQILHFTSLDAPRVYERPWKVEMRIGIISKEWFDYAKIEYEQPEGLDHLVLPPQMTFTNVKNGYGLIFASNEKTIELK